MAMLYQQLGASAFVALGVLIAVIPIQGRIASLTSAFARETMKHSDARLRLVTETVTGAGHRARGRAVTVRCAAQPSSPALPPSAGVKIIKLFAFESDFVQRIAATRDSELAVKRRTAFISALNSTILAAVPLLVALLTFLTYGFVSSTPLTAERAFASITLFGILRLPLFIFPMLVRHRGSTLRRFLARISRSHRLRCPCCLADRLPDHHEGGIGPCSRLPR